jgi:hypothetical protein
MRTVERPEWGNWVTPKLLRQRPVYRWYVYPHSYDKELVITLLTQMNIKKGEWVWDPFVGAGTTILACREYGCPAIGTDLLPISILVTQAKSRRYKLDSLVTELDKFSFGVPTGTIDRFAPIPIVRKALPAERRRQISNLLDQIDALPRASRMFFRIALIRSIEELGLAVKSGGWLRIDLDKDVSGKSLRTIFRHHAQNMLADLQLQINSTDNMQAFKIRLADARTVVTERQVSACITSPPYLNRHDYTRVFAIELALLGVDSPQELISLRHKTLRSHVEAKAPKWTKGKVLEVPKVVSDLVEEIEAADANDPRIPIMIKGYFEDMLLVMKNIKRRLKPGGKLAFVVGNTRFSGVMIPVDSILTTMGPAVGLEPKQIIVTRRRGNSAQQMGTYGREPSRESVVIFQKL